MKNLIYVICIIIILLVILLAIFSSYISLNTLAIIISLIAFILTPTLLILTIISISKGNNKKINKEKILIKNENTDKFIKFCLEKSKYSELPDTAILLLTPEAVSKNTKYFPKQD